MAKRRAPRSIPDGGTADPLPQPSLPACVASLGVRHSLFLLAALADAAVGNYRYGGVRSRLAPHKGFASQMLNELAECRAITLRVSLELPRLWPPASLGSGDPEWVLSEAFATTPDLPALLLAHARIAATGVAGADELFTLWRELAISEAAGFLAAELGDHRFDEGWALAAVPALERGLRQMSVNQMCWRQASLDRWRRLAEPLEAVRGTLSELQSQGHELGDLVRISARSVAADIAEFSALERQSRVSSYDLLRRDIANVAEPLPPLQASVAGIERQLKRLSRARSSTRKPGSRRWTPVDDGLPR